jgi:magnesium-transporting ATPase (P-type)
VEPTTAVQSSAASKRRSWFRIFKYGVFVLVLGNIVFYLVEDIAVLFYLDESAPFSDVLLTFAATIDYVAWMALIVLFEIGTSAQAKNARDGARKWTITGLSAAFYVVIIYAAYGYAYNLVDIYQYEPIASGTACDLVEDNFGYLNSKGRPAPLTAEKCAAFTTELVYRSPEDHLIVTDENLEANQKLAWVDVVNSVAWLLVVLIFMVEIFLKQRDELTKFRLALCTGVKVVLYLVLTADAIYWTMYSAVIDAWDAWLWLMAFILIDMNLLGVEDEPEDRRATQPAAAG